LNCLKELVAMKVRQRRRGLALPQNSNFMRYFITTVADVQHQLLA
jgi:hypothetical protein